MHMIFTYFRHRHFEHCNWNRLIEFSCRFESILMVIETTLNELLRSLLSNHFCTLFLFVCFSLIECAILCFWLLAFAVKYHLNRAFSNWNQNVKIHRFFLLQILQFYALDPSTVFHASESSVNWFYFSRNA